MGIVKRMTFNGFFRLVPIGLVALGLPLQAAQDDAEDERITVLDQTVPVAEDPQAETGPPQDAELEPEPSTREQMLDEFERFKELREAGVYDEALNSAKRVVEMSIAETGARSRDTAKALSNLALVQHQLRDFESAQQNFQAAIDIVTDIEDNLSPNLINPLRGLGSSQLEAGRPDLARRTFGQAVHISHVNEGPHNLDQIAILEALAETNLRLGELEDARNTQDMIYSLNLRYYSSRAIDMVPSLMRRAAWQQRTGHILDQRATYRRIIRIIEDTKGKDHVSLVEPLTALGQSYYYVDTSDASTYQSSSIASGEMYFKRALRIAEDDPESDWQMLLRTKLALGDYYNFRGELGRARKTYREVWELASSDDERLALREEALGTITPLNADPIPRYTAGATRDDRLLGDPNLREGRISIVYDVNARGRVSSLKIVEQDPPDFDDMKSFIVREMRTRIYRPRFIDAEPTDTPNQLLTHTFYYLQDELDKMRAEAAADDT